MSLKNSHLDEDGFFHVASFSRDVADAPICNTGMAFDPELDLPPKVSFNCSTHGHRRVEVSALCHNCGRRGPTLDDCPQCNTRHREYLTRIREAERARKKANARDELVKATRDLRIANADDSMIGAHKVCSRKYLLREEEAESSANLRDVSVEMPSVTDSGDGDKRRECRAARPPYAKRARADSSSRNCYFYLGWETPDGYHENYSSRETVCVEDMNDSREKNTVEWTTDRKAGKPEPRRKYFAGDNGSSRDESDSTDGDYKSCAETATDENNNTNITSTRNDGKDTNENTKQSLRSDESNWPAESDAQRCGRALGRNLSARVEYSGSACGKKTAIQCAAETKGRHDLKNFLELVRKMSRLSVQTQELVIRHVVAKRERLLVESSVGIGDPVQEFLDLVCAIAHLPIGTQNHVLFEVVAERDLTTRLHAA